MLSLTEKSMYRAVARDVTILRNPLPCGKMISELVEYKQIWFVLVVRTTVLQEIIKQQEKLECTFTEFRRIKLNERFGSTQLVERRLHRVHPQSSVTSTS